LNDSVGSNLLDGLRDEVSALNDDLVDLRREFHRHPELGLEEHRTAEVVAARLEQLGIPAATGVGKTGVVGLLEGGAPGPTLMLRADMDALPIQEENDVPYRSQNPGVMHACGHDGHMAILLTAAKVLNAHKSELPGRIKFVFQPGEEGFAGARLMIEDGVLAGPPVEAAFGLHLTTTLPVGVLAAGSGPMMASMDSFTLRIKGKGAHAALPNMGVDAIVISSSVVTTLQTLISKEVPPTTPLVLHIGTVNGGNAFNAVADRVELRGTVRTFDEELRASMPERMNRLIGGVVAAMRGSHELDYQFGYPALQNDEAMTRLVKQTVVGHLGSDAYTDIPPRMASEDMGFFLQKVPGCFFMLGAANPDRDMTYPNHNARFNFDEDALALGVRAMVAVAWNYLTSPAGTT